MMLRVASGVFSSHAMFLFANGTLGYERWLFTELRKRRRRIFPTNSGEGSDRLTDGEVKSI
jgi:hypothetical protein